MNASPDLLFPEGALDPLQILRVHNVELRRLLLERVGVERVLAGLKVKVVDEDRDPGGPRRLLHIDGLIARVLDCRCPSTARRYLLFVPPWLTRAHDAAAALADLKPQDYHPVLET